MICLVYRLYSVYIGGMLGIKLKALEASHQTPDYRVRKEENLRKEIQKKDFVHALNVSTTF